MHMVNEIVGSYCYYAYYYNKDISDDLYNYFNSIWW